MNDKIKKIILGVAVVVLVWEVITSWDYIWYFVAILAVIVVASVMSYAIYGTDNDGEDYKPFKKSHKKGISCPECGSKNVIIQTFQENRESETVSKTTGTYKEKGHGCMWWLTIGWWFWIIDLFAWVFATLPRLLLYVGRKRNYVERSKTVSKTHNRIVYKKVYACQKCGYQWED